MPDDFKRKALKMKQGDIRDRTNCDTTEVVWKDQCDVLSAAKYAFFTSKR